VPGHMCPQGTEIAQRQAGAQVAGMVLHAVSA